MKGAAPFIATREWRGRLHVNTLRSFQKEEDAVAYARGLDPVFLMVRVYEVFPDKPPRRIDVR